MTRGVDKHLLKQLAAGSSEAFQTIVERKRRVVRRFVEAGVGVSDVDAWEADVFSRAQGELTRLDPDEEDLTVHLLDILRDQAFSRLPENQFRATVFATGRDCCAAPPAIDPLPKEALSGETWPDLGPWVVRFSDRQQLLLELVFLEAAPIKGIAELVNCSENILSAFLYHVFDSMAELTALPHREGCPPDLFLGMEVVKARGHRTRVARLKEDHGSCAGCSAIIERSAALVGVWGREWRPEPPGLEALLTRISPGTQRTGKLQRAAPEPEPYRLPPAQATTSSHGASLGIIGAILVAFVWGSITFLGHRDQPADPDAAALAERARSAARAAAQRKLPTKLGAVSSASAASSPLYDGSDVATDLRNPATLAYESGVKVDLAPGGSGRAATGAFALVAGHAKIEVPAGEKPPFAVASGDVRLTSSGGVLDVLRTPGRRTILAVERGSATLGLPDGRTVTLEPGRQASIELATGKSTISDFSPADFSPLAGSGNGPAPGLPAPSPGPSDTSGEGSSNGSRSAGAGGGIRPSDARGFRDSF